MSMPALKRSALLILLICFCVSAKTPKLNITLKNFSPGEQKRKAQLVRLADEYDLTRYTITRDIVIDQMAINHSSPVLTLNLWHLDNDDRALSIYVHEQGHWLLMTRHRPQIPEMIAELMRLYPNIKINVPHGDGGQRSSYLHMAVIMLEWQALEQLIGAKRARAVLEWKRNDHYKDLFGTVMDHRTEMEALLNRYNVKW